MMRTTRSAILVAALALALGVSHTVAGASPARVLGSAEQRVVHDATKRFRDVDAAVAAGYVPVGTCVALAGVGGMGVHYLNPSLAGDAVVDPAHPELLVYVPDGHGRLTLGALEYFVADADQDLATDGDRPALFGRHAFDGPMPGHDPGMPVHYDLHVWLYEHNPAGQLATWNPRVACPPAAAPAA